MSTPIHPSLCLSVHLCMCLSVHHPSICPSLVPPMRLLVRSSVRKLVCLVGWLNGRMVDWFVRSFVRSFVRRFDGSSQDIYRPIEPSHLLASVFFCFCPRQLGAKPSRPPLPHSSHFQIYIWLALMGMPHGTTSVGAAWVRVGQWFPALPGHMAKCMSICPYLSRAFGAS